MKKTSLLTLLIMPFASLSFAAEFDVKDAIVFHYGPGPSFQEANADLEDDLSENNEKQEKEEKPKQDKEKKPTISFKYGPGPR